MSSFTPGPWSLLGKYIKAETEQRWVCELPWPEDGSRNARFQADARLIASAPELLEAAKVSRLIIREMAKECNLKPVNVLDDIDEAIAKAEGRV